jgi:cytochrome c553
MPIEVMGPDGTIQSVAFDFGVPSAQDRLEVVGHALAFRHPNRNPQCRRGVEAKASLRVNEGAWVDVVNQNVTVMGSAARLGGIGGGFHTIRFTLPVTLVQGRNTVEFRFNCSDGISNGYRVLSLDVIRGTQRLLPRDLFTEDDPSQWSAPLPTAADLQEGRRLWAQPSLLKATPYPNAPTLRASCAACHARDGRDLKYFNYSNWSIVARSVFHGLTERQGLQIASYIRSLNVPAPRNARPWNPPYQPGPGLDARPVNEWSAGAGLEAVLNSDRDMLPFLFSNGTTVAAMRSVTDASGRLNLRELPIAIQMPDWNAWLPHDHPTDVWGQLFDDGAANAGYLAARNQLMNNVSNTQLVTTINRIYQGSFQFIDTGGRQYNNNTSYAWLVLAGQVIDARRAGVSAEEAKLVLASWGAVKLWELMQEFGLESRQPSTLPRPEARAWPTTVQSVFHLAAHMIGNNRDAFAWQSSIEGDYFNNAWYYLQALINPGQRTRGIVDPVDWDYSLRHFFQLGERTQFWEPLRYVATTAKMYQERDNGAGPDNTGWMLRMMHPRWLFSDERKNSTLFATLDTYESGLWGKVVSSFIQSWLQVVSRPEFATWPRLSPNQVNQPAALFTAWSRLEPIDYVPNSNPYAGNLFFPLVFLNHADAFYRVIPEFGRIGADRATLNQLVDWCQNAWPRGNWASVRQ